MSQICIYHILLFLLLFHNIINTSNLQLSKPPKKQNTDNKSVCELESTGAHAYVVDTYCIIYDRL